MGWQARETSRRMALPMSSYYNYNYNYNNR